MQPWQRCCLLNPVPTNQAMKLILALLAGLALAAYILALADGPSLLEIIDNPKF